MYMDADELNRIAEDLFLVMMVTTDVAIRMQKMMLRAVFGWFLDKRFCQ